MFDRRKIFEAEFGRKVCTAEADWYRGLSADNRAVIADIQGLVDVQRDAIDWDRCLATARSLGEAIAVDIAGRLEAARRA